MIGQLTDEVPLTEKQRLDNWWEVYKCFANWESTLIEVQKECSNLEQ